VRKLGVVAIVVVGLLSISQGIVLLASTGSFVLSVDVSRRIRFTSTAFFLGGVLAAFLLALVLIVYRHQLAEWLFDEDDVSVTIGAAELLRVGLIFVGFDLVVSAIPSLIIAVVSAYQARDVMGGGPVGGILTMLSANFGLPLVRLILGIATIWASPWLARVLLGSETAAVSEPAPPMEACPVCGAPFDPSDYREGVERRCSACHSSMDARGGD
jgi:hypothetical protein